MRSTNARNLIRWSVTLCTAAGVAASVAVVPAWPGDGEGIAPTIREALRIRLESAGFPPRVVVGDDPVHALETTARFYETRAYQPAWMVAATGVEDAEELVATISRATEEGLDPSHYHAGPLRERLDEIGSARRTDRAPTVGELVDLELLLTDAFVLYGSHLLSGHINPETIDPEWFAARRGGDMAAVLEQALRAQDVAGALAALAPPQPGYRRLKDALVRYRETSAWPSIEEGPALRLGDRGPRVAALRTRLAAAGDLSQPEGETGDSDLFDDDLDEAVRRFQARHGGDVDGVVGKETSIDLNRPVDDRIRQIVVNLERWRWLPQTLGRRHVLVNIAGFDVRAVENGAAALEMRAIVGRTYRRTPVFSDQISYLVLNPSWTIPPSIAVQDKLPLIRKDPSYLARQGIKVYAGWGADAREIDPATVDWGAVGGKNFPYRLRQEPGPLNALGAVKFMFPNRFNVYLHDTPTRELFTKSARDFSSGCIRIERPLELAAFLLRPDAGWSRESLQSALAAPAEQTVRLPEPVPVHIQYWTAWVLDDGTVNFRKDLYGRDARVAEALREEPPGS